MGNVRRGYVTISIEIGEDTAQHLSHVATAAAVREGLTSDDERYSAFVADHRSSTVEAAYKATGPRPWSRDLASLAGRERTTTLQLRLKADLAARLHADATEAARAEGLTEGDAAGAVEAHTAALVESACCAWWFSADAAAHRLEHTR